MASKIFTKIIPFLSLIDRVRVVFVQNGREAGKRQGRRVHMLHVLLGCCGRALLEQIAAGIHKPSHVGPTRGGMNAN